MRVVRLILGNLAVFLALWLLVVAGTEVWARTRPRSWFVTFDPLLGFRLKPGAEGRYRGLSLIDPNPYIDSPVKINSLGMRGPEHSPDKPPGTKRVLILGDSFVQAFEVPYPETFYARMEERARREGVPVDVMAMGVMGWGTAQQYLWLRQEGLDFEPDLVIVLFFVFNDQFDNSMVLNANRGRPYFEVGEDGSLELVSLPDSTNRIKYFIADRFRSARLWTEVAQRVRPAFEALRALGVVDTRPQAEAEGYQRKLMDAFELSFALIEETRRLAAEHDSGFLLAYHGRREMGPPSSDEVMAEFCASSRTECLDLNRFTAARSEFFVPGDHHWTAAGHAVVANALWGAVLAALGGS